MTIASADEVSYAQAVTLLMLSTQAMDGLGATSISKVVSVTHVVVEKSGAWWQVVLRMVPDTPGGSKAK